MNLMSLNTEKIEELDYNKKINTGFFLNIINTKDLPFMIIENTSKGYPWGEWVRVARKIEELAYKYDFFSNYSAPENRDQIFNLFYYFPKYSTTNHVNLCKELLSLPKAKLSSLLDKKNICSLLYEYIIENEIREQFLGSYLYLLWAINTHQLISRVEEIKLLDRIISNIQIDNIIVRSMVNRLNALKSSADLKSISLKSEKRCAVIISGQFRFDYEIQDLIDSIVLNSSLNIQGVFIASWIEIGGIVTKEPKIYRYLDQDVISKIQSGHIDIQDVINKLNSLDKQVNENTLSKICSKPIKIKLNDENEYPYKSMWSAEKMYFNNEYWIKTLDEKYFIDNFDFIFKVRPDVKINKMDLASCVKACIEDRNKVFAEAGWIFRHWGFGMGDQILFGNSAEMVKLLSVHSNKELSSLVYTLYPKSGFYRGHVNLGIAAWLNNLHVNRIYGLDSIIKLPPKLSIDDLKFKV